MMKKFFDVLIIGGGASGLSCAIAAKKHKPELSVAVIERNDRVGKKLLATGNGRCNLTNVNISAEKYTGSFADKVSSVLDRIDCGRLLGFFSSLGLSTYSDSEGRVYPVSNQAASVLDVLRFACEREGVEIFCGESIKSIKQGGRFTVTTENGVFEAVKPVIACGSKAAPKLGGTAGGLDYLRNFGHRTVPFSPALCPVKVDSRVLKSLKGIRVKGEAALCSSGRLIKSERGEIQFTESALSGICVFNLSLYAKKGDEIRVDLMPGLSEDDVLRELKKRKKLFSSLTIDNLGAGLFQKRIMQAIIKESGIGSFSRLCNSLNEKELRSITKVIKAFRFAVTENAGFEQAQCALGGVLGSEIDETTMMSKKCRNMYVCGEVIDLCGECGGFNLHFAFASGIIAGESV